MTSPDHSVLRPLLPLARLSLAAGLKLPDLIEAMKAALVQAALTQAPANPLAPDGNGPSPTPGKLLSDSQLSVITGVHRKDLRRLKTGSTLNRPYKASLSSQVFGRWRSDPFYLTKSGTPRVLNRAASDEDGRSFEILVTSISTDVHPRSVLDDLIRLGMVETAAGDRLKLVARAFVPRNDDRELWEISAQNATDHLSSIAHNLLGGDPAFLEQAIFTDELSEEGAAAFNRLTAQSWKLVFDHMLPQLRTLIAEDRKAGRAAEKRVTLGLYSHVAAPQEKTPSAHNKLSKRTT